MIIAIDGPAAAGKGTLARDIAERYGLHYLDTGLLYRAVAWLVLRNNHKPGNNAAALAAASSLDLKEIDVSALRTPQVSEAASIVAALPDVRTAILNYQRRFAKKPPGVVLDGRDIGTVVCPNADVKLFVTANDTARAHRRFLELSAAGSTLTEQEVLDTLTQRDARDTTRAVAPLVKANDAHLLDTTNLDIEAAFKAAIEIIDRSLQEEGAPSQ